MKKDTPTSSVYSSLDPKNDKRPQLTRPNNDDFSQEDKSGIKLAADPRYHHTLDELHEYCTEKQEQLELKLQILRQQETRDRLSSKLIQCEVENEVLKAEKAVLVDELALRIQEQTITRLGCFSKGDKGNCKSMQLLINTNTKLVTDNTRLQVLVDLTRKSFQSYIKDSRRQHSTQHSKLRNSLHSISEQELKFGTSGDDWIIDGVELEADNNAFIRVETAPVTTKPMEFIFCKETEKSLGKGAVRSKSEELLVGFGESETRRLGKTDRRCHILTEGTANRKSEDLLVNSSRHSNQHSKLRNSLHSIPEQELKFGTYGDDWTIDGVELEADSNAFIRVETAPVTMKPMEFIFCKETEKSLGKGAVRSKSEELLVEFGETETRRLGKTDRRCHSLTEGTANRKSDDLLVNFGETRRI